MNFIKSTQGYYRHYIRLLYLNFGGIPELEQVCQNIEPNQATKTVVSGQQVSQENRQAVLQSCLQTLIRLGDLSRYRALEGSSKQNWDPAVAYYHLASIINPAWGIPHNQLSIIALERGNHVDILYHLYRALAVDEPHPMGAKNLEIEFRKIASARRKGEDLVNCEHVTDDGVVLQDGLIDIQRACYRAGLGLKSYESIEADFFNQLWKDLSTPISTSLLWKVAITNIASSHVVRLGMQGELAMNFSPTHTDISQVMRKLQLARLSVIFD